MRFLYVIIFLFILSACQSGGKVCRVPELMKMKKASLTRKKSSERQLQARASERKVEKGEQKKPEEITLVKREKKAIDAEEWDCPKPGTTEHMKMIRKQQKKNQKKYEESLKQKEKLNAPAWEGPYKEK